MNHLRDLPNASGFKFIGITKNGDRINCVVEKNKIGRYSVYGENGDLVYFSLIGWEEKK